jgi:hypothetical protein
VAYRNIEDSRAAIRRHYYLNKDKYLLRNKLRREKLRQYVKDLKSKSPCKDCGKHYPYYVMDFDHLGDKVYMISSLVNAGRKQALEDGIKKCDVVCSNCHRMRSHSRLMNKPA